ncbi:MAG: hypothetical protein C4K48_09130 [Candidatus Thorarchaeota archaeon]|nr:MAG: hypothetical protein C4K48_09130 [Candidatus Thorarchaeota archaeon]
MEAVDILIDMSEKSIWENERGTFIKVIVRPNSRSKEFVSEMTPEAVHLNLTGPAREGKANTELVKRMAKTLGVTTGTITMVAGHRSREKTLLVTDITREVVIQKLSEAI